MDIWLVVLILKQPANPTVNLTPRSSVSPTLNLTIAVILRLKRHGLHLYNHAFCTVKIDQIKVELVGRIFYPTVPGTSYSAGGHCYRKATRTIPSSRRTIWRSYCFIFFTKSIKNCPGKRYSSRRKINTLLQRYSNQIL